MIRRARETVIAPFKTECELMRWIRKAQAKSFADGTLFNPAQNMLRPT